MNVTTQTFKDNVKGALRNETLVHSLETMKTGFRAKRAVAVERMPEFEALRDAGRDLKDHVLENLDFYLEAFEAKVLEAGGKVHWCRDAQEAREAVLAICRSADAKTVTKGKSMISEEMGLNDYLEANGVRPVETDLGEYIIQLRHEHPSHIVAPAIHVRKAQVAEAFAKPIPNSPPIAPSRNPGTCWTRPARSCEATSWPPTWASPAPTC
jgi:L-lactate dehydrogenase complex protein LldF